MFHVVEGFYGKPWSHEERLDMIDFLAGNGFSGYCYAPKADKKLRQDIATAFDECELLALQDLADRCSKFGLTFRVGLSPYKFLAPDTDKTPFLQKLKQLKAIKGCSIALLFDDISLNDQNLAKHQVEFVEQVASELQAKSMTFCPSYYSYDPVLNKVFGEMPKDYWQDLGSNLGALIDVLWTGEKVISQTYSKAHIKEVSGFFNRKLTIWDNASVSDGKKTSPFLPLSKVADFSAIKGDVAGIWINPMNPPALAKINLLMAMQGQSQNLESALDKQAPELKADILNSLASLEDVGLDDLTDDAKKDILFRFERFEHPAAKNIVDWVKGVYRFDPECLT